MDSESISYENTKFKRFGNCHHTKTKFRTLSCSGIPSGTCWQGSSDPSDWIDHFTDSGPYGLLPWNDGESPLPLWSFYPRKPQHLKIYWGALDIQSLLARAIKEMTPEIESELSLLVSLAELGDIKNIIKAPLKISRELCSRLRRGFRDKSATAITAALGKSSSDVFLTHTFGTKQVVSDIAGVMSVFQMVESRLRSFVEKANTIQTRHWRLPTETKKTSQDRDWPLDGNWYGVTRWSTEGKRDFYVTMKYTYRIVDALGNPIDTRDTDLLKMGAWLDSLGINMNPAILWDLIPFSFVVDWFVKVGDWLEGFKVNNLNSAVTILDMCYSTKTQVTSVYATQRHISGGSNHNADLSSPVCGTIVTQLETSTYDRVRVTPTASLLYGSTLPELGSPTWGKFWTGTSLLTSNLIGK